MGHKISKKKLRKISKIPNIDKVRKPRESHPVSPITPKEYLREEENNERMREMSKRMRSPGVDFLKIPKKPSGKMYSMPASPAKDRKEYSPTVVVDMSKKRNKKKH